MKKRGSWEQLEYYSKGSIIGLCFGLVVSILLALFSYFDCAGLKCIAGNILYYTLSSLFFGFSLGFIVMFFSHWSRHGRLRKLHSWQNAGILFFLVNLLLFVLAVYEFYPLPRFLDIFYSFPMYFAEYLGICSGPDLCGAYAFMGFFAWISASVLLAGALFGYVIDKLIIFLIISGKEIGFISHRHDKKQSRIALAIFVIIIILIPFILIVSNVKLTAFNMDFYNAEFMKYSPDVKNKEVITSDMLEYLGNEDAGTELISEFNQDEISHLQDVKHVLLNFSKLLSIAMLVLIVLFVLLCVLDMYSFMKDIGYIFLFGGALSSGLILLAALWLLDFDNAFIAFHSVFFQPGTWEFPVGSMLTTLLPEQFWIDISNRIIGNVLIASMIIMVMGLIVFLLSKSLSKKNKY